MTRRRTPRARPGRIALFRDKDRRPVSLTLTRAHHLKVRRAVRRLGLTRADVIGLLIEKFADVVTLSPYNTPLHRTPASHTKRARANTKLTD
jgi:hypothetical protein